jgi:acyl dehydratase
MSLSLDEALEQSQSYIGTTGPAVSMTIDASQIRLFAEAIGDPNPLYYDEDYARSTRWGGVIAPPTLLCMIFAPLPVPRVDFGLVGLNGGSSFEAFRPVRPGDTITGQARLANVRAVRGRSGEMLITERETRYTNGKGQLVALGGGTGIQK